MLRREETRLRIAFERILALSIAASGAACSSGKGAHAGADAGTHAAHDAGATEAGAADAATSDAALDDGGGDATLPSGLDATTGEDGASPEDASSADDVATCSDGAPVFLEGANDDSGCEYIYSWNLPCGLPGAATENCFLGLTTCATICGRSVTCSIAQCADAGAGEAGIAQTTGSIDVVCDEQLPKPGCVAVGRRPAGLVNAGAPKGVSAAAAWLAASAHLEAASIEAFERLADDLTALGAPDELVAAAKSSARDETRHAKTMTRLAHRRGASPTRPVVTPRRGPASLLGLALENAVEGCVRETFGALVASRQAARATDRTVARAMARIHRDETRHAALAWSIARWVEPRLDAHDRAHLAAARRSALAALRCETAHDESEARAELGLPGRAEAARMLDAFARDVRGALTG